MAKMRRSVLALAAIVLTCAGCWSQQSRTVSGQVNFGTTGKIEVAVPIGNVTVTGSQGSLVTWSAHEAARRRSDLERMNVVTDKLPGELIVRGVMPVDCRMCAINLVIAVPRNVSLDVRTGVGNVSVDGTSAAVIARSRVGNVDVTGAGQQVQAQSRVGNVRVTLPSMTGIEAVTVTSSVGDVSLSLPRSADAMVHLATSLGRITGDVAVSRATGLGSEARLRLGSGRVPIELRTQTGDVSLRML
jgi:hypothetical protein